ncbi:NTP transferase domain-containing protein [Halapricum sp. CBA1109]|uniref:sugar phosphate nucleotidyltransferase n=1 Tax=Halapricum sp. CBA1109 TaxID=2668068 RepID=UPI0012FC97D3|nr:sugar phosphate nucleotidyltransferase [Halapricum sp. CBA1109]MUV89462.1 NTP transferase domain-containing protein [Halapricum sp. CBA1109]
MKAVIPAAGQGTRLYPQTYTKPKPLVRIAGKPILGHILDNLVESRIDDVVVVVGVMREMVVDYVTGAYGDRFDLTFVDQEQTEGLGHSVYQARSAVDGDSVCILLGDMLFDSGYEAFLEAHDALGECVGSLGVKRVEDPSSYGIVTLDDAGCVVDLTEKPEDPSSNLAISGIYCIENSTGLFGHLEHLIENDVRGAGGEYQLTDALARMVESGETLRTFDVQDWYDCGRPATLLEANRLLLDRREPTSADPESGVVIPPVDIGEDVDIVNSVVGPYVSVDDHASIVDSRVKGTIVGARSEVVEVNLSESIVGDGSTVTATPTHLNIGDSSEVEL